ncbi:MAG: HDOD domain-containing protein [Gammaproteobacteria bacterium]|nr:MAG: HDOD domain-containing protein [Gammaproteobacteria bacterium]
MGDEVSRAFAFVRELVANLPGKDIDLPAFPDVVRRLQVALADPDTSARDLVVIIESEPVLSARLLQMANSAAVSAAGNPATSIKAAVSRLGFNLVRLTAMTHAMRQMERNESLQPIRPELGRIWRASNEVAAICYVVARRAFGRQPDEAMLAGLLHGIGALYIVSHTQKVDPVLRADPDFQAIVRDWQPRLGKAILDAWGLPERIGQAVARQDELLGTGPQDLEPLARLLSAAKFRHRLGTEPDLRRQLPQADDVMRAVTLGDRTFLDLVAAGHQDIEEMQQLLAA